MRIRNVLNMCCSFISVSGLALAAACCCGCMSGFDHIDLSLGESAPKNGVQSQRTTYGLPDGIGRIVVPAGTTVEYMPCNLQSTEEELILTAKKVVSISSVSNNDYDLSEHFESMRIEVGRDGDALVFREIGRIDLGLADGGQYTELHICVPDGIEVTEQADIFFVGLQFEDIPPGAEETASPVVSKN